ncbi:prepilin-type N-terminal cleavage/methylation domain-containing protein [Sulfurimonas microaerophilic]|uniref:prepilin-type N-terminal cleavage/methylation domain-containing protein n=1 Tax=Sulfurimonas microaerophilic TaxID=3058392 RepID=UPI002715064C|nr:prepilin-type N-terminal cleavage/methylation domain-containing protein [Sulfurimonas sp. hsl 1-7]
MAKQRNAFTLIEVMVAVMIVSVVIAAMFQVRGDANSKLLWLQQSIKETQYNSFLLGTSQKYGFEKSNVSLKELVDDFNLESDLRREVKAIKVKLSYDEIDKFETPTGSVLEIGKTKLESQKFSTSMLRVKIQ